MLAHISSRTLPNPDEAAELLRAADDARMPPHDEPRLIALSQALGCDPELLRGLRAAYLLGRTSSTRPRW